MWWFGLAWAVDVRGITVSTPTWGREWGSDEMAATLDLLSASGVNWVAIHPYAGIDASGRVTPWAFDPADPPAWLVRPIAEAHARGVKVLVVPHVAHWGSPFAWRGEIAFPPGPARDRFFQDYTRWVVELAAVARGADAFAVGSELDATVAGAEDRWRGLIAEVRRVHPGHLTYAANWDRFDAVPFWDALDAVGVQAYFPIGAVGEQSPERLAAGWDAVLARMRAVHARTGRPVVFTELGYDAGVAAPATPWASGDGGAAGAAVQAACLRAALAALEREPAVAGAFLWKWMPGEAPVGDFRLSTPENHAIVREAWAPR